MKRRGFLQTLLSLGTAPLLSKVKVLPDKVAVPSSLDTSISFGLSSVKEEGGIISSGDLMSALWPGVRAWYAESYKKVYLEGTFDLQEKDKNA
jgi:hypothetical protein